MFTRLVQSLREDTRRRRWTIAFAAIAVLGLGWVTGTLIGEDATQNSLLGDTSVVRVVAPGGSSCGVQEKTVSVEAEQLTQSTDPSSYPILGLQEWSFVLHYDPAVLRFIRDAGSVSAPVGLESRKWTLMPTSVDTDRGAVSVRVSSQPTNQQLPLAGAIRPESGRPLILGSIVFAPIAPGYSRISVDDVVLVPVGSSTALPPPSVTDVEVATACP